MITNTDCIFFGMKGIQLYLDMDLKLGVLFFNFACNMLAQLLHLINIVFNLSHFPMKTFT